MFALAYIFKLPNIPDILNHFLKMKMLCKKKWDTSSLVVRPFFTIDILFSLPYFCFINIDILDKLLVSLSYVVWLMIMTSQCSFYLYFHAYVFLRKGENRIAHSQKNNPDTFVSCFYQDHSRGGCMIMTTISFKKTLSKKKICS